MPSCCSSLRTRIQTWLRDYDKIQSLAVILIYIQIGCALLGSLGALYNGVLLINFGIALFALVAIESSSQSLGRTYAVLLFCAIVLDVFWFILFSQQIWSISATDYGIYFFFSVKLALWMQILGFLVRLSSSFLWIQIYRLGASYVNNTVSREADFDPRNSFLSPTTPALVRQLSGSDEVLGGSIYDPVYYSSLFEDGDRGVIFGGHDCGRMEDGSTSAEKSQVKPSVERLSHAIDVEIQHGEVDLADTKLGQQLQNGDSVSGVDSSQGTLIDIDVFVLAKNKDVLVWSYLLNKGVLVIWLLGEKTKSCGRSQDLRRLKEKGFIKHLCGAREQSSYSSWKWKTCAPLKFALGRQLEVDTKAVNNLQDSSFWGTCRAVFLAFDPGNMDDAVTARYWCHMCSQMVNPIMEVEIKCPFCQSGFVEEMDVSSGQDDGIDSDLDFGSDRALSLWAPILLGMMGNNRRRRRRFRLDELDEEEDNEDGSSNHRGGRHFGDTELDRELESIIRRRRRSSATILQLLQGIRAGMSSESENASDGDRDRDRDRERVILINPFNQTIILQGSYDPNQPQNQNQTPAGSLGDYFIGPGLDLLLQHLAENDTNRYGTPPAKKEAVDAMPTVVVEENLQCSVCLDDFETGAEAKEMPCKHKFHVGCILPWLELHSSCPVCRHQMPADESKLETDGLRSRSSSNSRRSSSDQGGGSEEGDGDEGRNGHARRFSVPIPWPFSGLFSSSGSQSGVASNSSSTEFPSSSSSSSSRNVPGGSRADEN
ncbi:Zinc finger, RING-type [Dillenia turbinata]|uniref:RING-type E3 ubiquitin transferase n=1 Tax=Dillenia turbinata TaxID=194707 RepID=A0AAN8VE03_9MAGN